MDEFDRGGFDPEVTKFFKKIVSSFSFGMIWMLVMSTAGLYFRLALVDESVRLVQCCILFCFFRRPCFCSSVFVQNLEGRVIVGNHYL
jgi:hypothetical protein